MSEPYRLPVLRDILSRSVIVGKEKGVEIETFNHLDATDLVDILGRWSLDALEESVEARKAKKPIGATKASSPVAIVLTKDFKDLSAGQIMVKKDNGWVKAEKVDDPLDSCKFLLDLLPHEYKVLA